MKKNVLRKKYFIFITIAELVIASVVIVRDIWNPTLFVLILMIISFVLRKDSFSTLGFFRPKSWKRMIFGVLGFSILWTLINLSFILPVLNHLTGTNRDVSMYLSLKGNIPMLGILLGLTWTLAAFGEEIVYRGYLQKRLGEIFINKYLLVVIISSLIFGFAHTEQGIVGVTTTTIDALFYCFIKRRFRDNLWASVFTHGFMNTIGIIGYFLIGPIYSFW